jgi:hypothetical protein
MSDLKNLLGEIATTIMKSQIPESIIGKSIDISKTKDTTSKNIKLVLIEFRDYLNRVIEVLDKMEK